MILVTGGSGFIGANFILDRLSHNSERVINLDKLNDASNQNSLRSLTYDDRYIFKQGDIDNRILVSNILAEYRPRAIVNFAAESHVD
jgi:dTDP-glucose 4,6-dehydratase